MKKTQNNIHVRNCPECCETIKMGAKRCKHCQAQLTWLRHISLSSTTLALLVALISVMTTFTNKIYDIFKKPNSEVSLSAASVQSNMIATNITNIGDRPGWLSEASVTIVVDLENYGITELEIELQPIGNNFPISIYTNSEQFYFRKMPESHLFPKPAKLSSINNVQDENIFPVYGNDADNINIDLLSSSLINPQLVKECYLDLTINNFDGTYESFEQSDITKDRYGITEKVALLNQQDNVNGYACIDFLWSTYEHDMPELLGKIKNELFERKFYIEPRNL